MLWMIDSIGNFHNEIPVHSTMIEDNMEVATPACREMAVLMKADVIVIVMADCLLWRICI